MTMTGFNLKIFERFTKIVLTKLVIGDVVADSKLSN